MSSGLSLGDLDGSARRPRDAVSNDVDRPVLPLHVMERRAIETAIRACSGNIPRAAALLEVSPSTLYRKKAQWDENLTPAQDSSGGQVSV